MKSFVTQAARWCWLPLSLLATACDRPEAPVPPPNLLSKQQVTSMLIAVHLLESRIESSRYAVDSARALFLSQERELLQKHHISTADSAFERSYRYYAVHDKDLEEIYAVVIDSLNAQAVKLGGYTKPPEHH
ncbi:MAG: DUF4296 domain-containing protein [Janthinobacterium lividum]